MNFVSRLRRERLLAIVRGDDPDAMVRVIDVLAASGIGLIEISLTSTDALGVIRCAVGKVGDAAVVGAGTVLNDHDAIAAREAGAAFLVTPGGTLREPGLPVIAGALTPTEVAHVIGLGAAAVKLFPASLGGPAYLAALRQPFPDVPFVPVGGVDAATAPLYLSVGAVAVGVGSPLLGDTLQGGDLDELARRAEAFRSAVAEVLV